MRQPMQRYMGTVVIAFLLATPTSAQAGTAEPDLLKVGKPIEIVATWIRDIYTSIWASFGPGVEPVGQEKSDQHQPRHELLSKTDVKADDSGPTTEGGPGMEPVG